MSNKGTGKSNPPKIPVNRYHDQQRRLDWLQTQIDALKKAQTVLGNKAIGKAGYKSCLGEEDPFAEGARAAFFAQFEEIRPVKKREPQPGH
jgi:hypothetical protein